MMKFPIDGKIKNVPNHQPDIYIYTPISGNGGDVYFTFHPPWPIITQFIRLMNVVNMFGDMYIYNLERYGHGKPVIQQ